MASEAEVSANANLCHDCGWREEPARKNYRKCPECGAPFVARYVERTFARTGDSNE